MFTEMPVDKLAGHPLIRVSEVVTPLQLNNEAMEGITYPVGLFGLPYAITALHVAVRFIVLTPRSVVSESNQ